MYDFPLVCFKYHKQVFITNVHDATPKNPKIIPIFFSIFFSRCIFSYHHFNKNPTKFSLIKKSLTSVYKTNFGLLKFKSILLIPKLSLLD